MTNSQQKLNNKADYQFGDGNDMTHAQKIEFLKTQQRMTNETKQTAVEQLFIEMLEIQQSGKTLTFDENVELLNKYKEMEKEQMIEFAKEVFIYRYYGIQERLSDIANDIYNETYGGNK